jgi:hypothetical protein
MSAAGDESAERAERVRVVEFWRAVEVFSPQPLPRPDPRIRVADVAAGGPAPWEAGSGHCGPAPAGKAWRHEVFGGVFPLSRVRDTLTGLYGPDADGGQREPAKGQSALFACTVDGAGSLIPRTAVLSSCAWAVARALTAPDNPSLADFDEGARQFAGDLARLAGQNGAAADDLRADGLLIAGAGAAPANPGAAPANPGAAEPSPGTARPGGPPDERSGDAVKPGRRPPRPLSGAELGRFAAGLAERLGVAGALRPRGLRVRSYLVDAERAAGQTAPSFLNSCYADDLARVAAAVADGTAGPGLTAYLTSGARIDAGQRVDVRARPDAVWHGCLPDRIPPGRWPAGPGQSLALSQQFAVNEIIARLGDAPGLVAVNGPPGTGKTTLLRDLIAAVVAARAERLADLDSPADAFGSGAQHNGQSGGGRHPVTPLNPSLTGAEIVIASASNGAVEDVTAEIPGPDGIGDQWRAAAARVDYFTATARLGHGDGAWAMIAARLGDAWGGAPGRRDGGLLDLLDLLGRPAGRPADWDAARAEFRAAAERVAVLAAERAKAALAVSRLPALRRDAATAYDAVSAAEDRLRTLADQRVSAERTLRDAWHRYGTVLQAQDAHTRAKPGLPALLATRFGARREWLARQASLEQTRGDHAAVTDSAQWALTQIQAEFAAAVRERTAAAAALRRLSAECAVAREAASQGRRRWGDHFPSGPEFSAGPAGSQDSEPRNLSAPWADEEFAAARTELFLAALALHKAVIVAQSRRVRRNLSALADFLRGQDRPDDPALLAAWQTLFLLVPAVSTTFASLPATFGGLGAESIGWLLVDEAGQAPPQQAAGAIWRARRTVVVGDPGQLEPLVTLPWGGQRALLRRSGADEEWAPSRTSVQRVADRLMRYGTLLRDPADPEASVWVGIPLSF